MSESHSWVNRKPRRMSRIVSSVKDRHTSSPAGSRGRCSYDGRMQSVHATSSGKYRASESFLAQPSNRTRPVSRKLVSHGRTEANMPVERRASPRSRLRCAPVRQLDLQTRP